MNNKLEKALEEYNKKFGGFPSYLVMGLSDNDILMIIERALEHDKPLKIKKDRVY